MKAASDISSLDFQGVRIDLMTLESATSQVARARGDDVRRGRAVHLCNAYTLALASADQKLKEELNDSWLNLCDGTPLGWFARAYGIRRARAVRGPSLLQEVLGSARPQLPHYFYGGSPSTAQALKQVLPQRFPNAEVVDVVSPPFGMTPEQFASDLNARLQRLPSPCVVWVGLGTPRQDYVVNLAARSTAGLFIAIGAAVDFVAGTQRQAPPWLRNSGFEWAYRLARQPGRLWRRYTLGSAIFAYRALRQLTVDVVTRRRALRRPASPELL